MERLTEFAGIYGNEKMYVLDTLDKKSKQDLINDLGRAEDLIEEKDKEIEKLKNMAVVDMQNGEMLELEIKTLKTKTINLLKKFVKLTEKDKEIERLKREVLNWQDGSMALKIEKETRHKVFQEIKKYIRDKKDKIMFIDRERLSMLLDQIEGEK